MKIRRIVLALVLFLALAYTGIVLANNHIAEALEEKLKGFPLPPGATLQDSLSVAGKTQGNGNGMQYYGAILIDSDLSEGVLRSHYSLLETREDALVVARQEGPEVFDRARFKKYEAGGNSWLVMLARYSAVGAEDSLWERILNVDIRGH